MTTEHERIANQFCTVSLFQDTMPSSLIKSFIDPTLCYTYPASSESFLHIKIG